MSLTRAKELAVLSLLEGHDLHGYAIASALEQGFGRLLGIKRPAIYAMLEKFRKNGWIAGTPEASGNYPNKEVFALTEKGREAVTALRQSVSEVNLPLSPLLALFIESEISGTELNRKKLIEQRQEALQAIEDLLSTEHGHSPSLSLARHLFEAEIKALKDNR